VKRLYPSKEPAPVDPAEVERVLAELHVARKFTRAFWPNGHITRALVGCTNSLKAGEYTPAEIEEIAVDMLEMTTGMSRTGEEMP
jgi:hypothetical protein